jgi:uncharacterized alpha/beta hydrolase family protein
MKNNFFHDDFFSKLQLDLNSYYSKIPVILVHGAEGKAKTLLDVRNHFFKNHYADSEVYSTTWGDGGKTKSFSVTMKCSYVKHVNLFNTISLN